MWCTKLPSISWRKKDGSFVYTHQRRSREHRLSPALYALLETVPEAGYDGGPAIAQDLAYEEQSACFPRLSLSKVRLQWAVYGLDSNESLTPTA